MKITIMWLVLAIAATGQEVKEAKPEEYVTVPRQFVTPEGLAIGRKGILWNTARARCCPDPACVLSVSRMRSADMNNVENTAVVFILTLLIVLAVAARIAKREF